RHDLAAEEQPVVAVRERTQHELRRRRSIGHLLNLTKLEGRRKKAEVNTSPFFLLTSYFFSDRPNVGSRSGAPCSRPSACSAHCNTSRTRRLWSPCSCRPGARTCSYPPLQCPPWRHSTLLEVARRGIR